MIREIFLTYYMKLLLSRYMNLAPVHCQEIPEADDDKELLLYIHIPFCEELCPYCSFIRERFDGSLVDEYIHCLKQEITLYREKGYRFSSLYVGGGTPTIIGDKLGSLLHWLRNLRPIREISVETNPNHLTETVLTGLEEAGVSRLSVGVQTFNDTLLRRLDRFHTYGSGNEIKNRLVNARGRFETLNVDMIFNLPGQTRHILDEDLAVLLEINADQITYYPLMTGNKVKTRLFRQFGHSSYRKEHDFYRIIESRLENAYTKATAWCFSRKDSMIDEYIVNYNEYIGTGAGAFSYHHGTLYANSCRVEDYCKRMRTGKLPFIGAKGFSPGRRMRYALLMDLFDGVLDRGTLLQTIRSIYGGSIPGRLFYMRDTSILALSGAVIRQPNGFRLSDRGYYFVVIMMREFFNSVNNFRDFCR